MNPTIELLLKRRSVRQYDPTPLTDEEKEAILAATLRAPTAGAMMLYTIIEIDDQVLKDRLAVTCDDQPFIASAPYLLLFLADYQRWFDLYQAGGCEAKSIELGQSPRQPAEGDLMLAMMDAMIAAHTAVIAAESLGIGSCYIGDILENWEAHRDLFHLPRYTFPAALICFGRPTQAQLQRKLTARFERRFVVHQNSYRQFSPAELNDVHLPFGMHSFDPRSFANGAENVVQFNYTRKFTAPFSVEMTRSARAALKSWTDGD